MKTVAERVAYNRTWRAANPDKVAAYKKRWPQNPEKKAECTKQWRAENPDKVAAANKRWYDANAENKRAYRKEHYRKTGGYETLKQKLDVERRAAYSRRHAAKKHGYVECTVFPSRPMDSRCDICSRVKKLVLDHDHHTGAFRGYICRDCNMGIGKLGDNLDGLLRAVEYLRAEPRDD